MKPDAADRLAAAQREVELSRRRLADTHEKVVKPLRGYAAQNNFADLIAQSLINGPGRDPGRGTP
jgi:hypothetical protein